MASNTLPKTMLAWQKHLQSKDLVNRQNNSYVSTVDKIRQQIRREVPVPVPKEGEILVEIHAAGGNYLSSNGLLALSRPNDQV